ncbi:MAG: DMSO reductase [Rhodocyclaceae bacterium]|nr:DMSO reductase [Rhodocyclaceae bacterium]
MHPAFSVVFLSYAAFGLLPGQDSRFYALGSAVALGFLVAGLVASFFHLGRPERAWRSAAKWRTSWLSREVIVLPAFMGAVFLYGIAHHAGFNPLLATLPSAVPVRLTFLLGMGGTLLAFALFVCTAMIYACLRFLQEWHTPQVAGLLGGWAMILTALACLGRAASLLRNARLKPKSSLRTAIGARHPRIVQKAQGAMGGSFNTREFFHGRTPGFLRQVKWIFLVLAFALPLGLLAAGAAGAAFIVQYLGLLAERWFFFAQANHPQNLYYQGVS